MIINPHTEESHKTVQAEEIEMIRKEIRKLHIDVRELIKEGEQVIESCLEFKKKENKNFNFNIHHLNVFSLERNVSGDVMKYLAMLCSTAGFHHVSIGCDCHSSFNLCDNHVTYPNAISFKAFR